VAFIEEESFDKLQVGGRIELSRAGDLTLKTEIG
jgi:hypothetical protein